MMIKAIMPVLDVLKGRIADTDQRLTSQYRMMQMAHHRYNLLFRWTHEMLIIHHFALLLFKNYLTIQVGMLQRIHHQYNRYESSLDDKLIGIESLSSGYLTHHYNDHFEINLVARLLNQIYVVQALPPGYDYDNLHANVMDEPTPSTSTGATISAPCFLFRA